MLPGSDRWCLVHHKARQSFLFSPPPWLKYTKAGWHRLFKGFRTLIQDRHDDYCSNMQCEPRLDKTTRKMVITYIPVLHLNPPYRAGLRISYIIVRGRYNYNTLITTKVISHSQHFSTIPSLFLFHERSV